MKIIIQIPVNIRLKIGNGSGASVTDTQNDYFSVNQCMNEKNTLCYVKV